MTGRLKKLDQAIQTAENEGVPTDGLKAVRDALAPVHAESHTLGDALDLDALIQAYDLADCGEALRGQLRAAGFVIVREHRTDLVPGVAQLMELHATGHPQFTVAQWRQRVAANDTLSGYWDWLRMCLVDTAMEAEKAGIEAGE